MPPPTSAPAFPGSPVQIPASISHVLLDIEGTTCPVSFVSEVLFPHARAQLGSYLGERAEEPQVKALVAELEQAWRAAQDPEAIVHGQPADPTASPRERALALVPYLEWLIDHDRKLTPLKDLQGWIWEEGYASGVLQGPLFEDVAPALRRWQEQGLALAVYSSGSVQAQQLIYGHSTAGDLRELFSAWFDTRIGPKQAAASYTAIAAELGIPPESVLFLSDSLAELDAAAAAGCLVAMIQRPGNPAAAPHRHPILNSFDKLNR
ncbi:MAG: acireductone synthase [Synechococcus sp.]|nr:acireductone synthase [Synechococcus sp.]